MESVMVFALIALHADLIAGRINLSDGSGHSDMRRRRSLRGNTGNGQSGKDKSSLGKLHEFEPKRRKS